MINETPGPLRYTVGQRIAGLVCGADEAFDKLDREVARLAHTSLWSWFAERAQMLETKLVELGGFDEGIADQMENGGYFGRSEDFDLFDQTKTLMFELDSLAGAFFVTLQPRLNAVRVAAKTVYEKASGEDGLAIAVPSNLQVPTDFEAAWEVANFVKHNDEWGTKLQPRQQRAFAVLCRLDVADERNGERQFARFPLLMGACALAGETLLAPAINAIAARCQTDGRGVMTAIQNELAPYATEIEAVRRANAPRLRVRSSKP